MEQFSDNSVPRWYRDSLCNTKDRKFISRKPYKGQPNKTKIQIMIKLEMKLVRPFGPSILHTKIPVNTVEMLNKYIDDIVIKFRIRR